MISSFQNKNSSSTHALPKNSGVVRALGITSGGLDSILSALILREQGIDVEWVNFETPFFGSEKARKAALMAGIPLTVKRITQTRSYVSAGRFHYERKGGSFPVFRRGDGSAAHVSN